MDFLNMIKWIIAPVTIISIFLNACIANLNETAEKQCVYDCALLRSCPLTIIETTYDPIEVQAGITLCCPGFYLTTNKRCQVCNDITFMPGANNCDRCFDCADCDSLESPDLHCTRTRDAVCKDMYTTVPAVNMKTCPQISTVTSSTDVTSVSQQNVTQGKAGESSSSIISPIVLAVVIIVPVLVVLLVGFIAYLWWISGSTNDAPDSRGKRTLRSTLQPIADKVFSRRAKASQKTLSEQSNVQLNGINSSPCNSPNPQ